MSAIVRVSLGALICLSMVFPSRASGQDLYAGVWRAGNDGYYLWNGVNWAGLEAKDAEVRPQNLRLIDIEPIVDGGTVRFGGVWRAGTAATTLFVKDNWTDFENALNSQRASGNRIVDIETWLDNNVRRFAAIVRPGTGREEVFVATDLDRLKARVTDASAGGLRVVTLKPFREGASIKWLTVLNEGADRQEVLFAADWDTFNARWRAFSGQGLRLADFVTHMDGGQRLWSGVFRAGTDSHLLWVGTSWDGFQAKWREASRNGLRLARMKSYRRAANRPERIALFQRPAVMGDSLTHGFYGVLVRPDTQAWAFPVLVQNQARADVPTAVPGIDRLNYNLLRGPGVDMPAAVPADIHGHTNTQGACDAACAASNYSGSANSSLGTRFATSITPVNHVGITGADFWSAITTNDVCVDLRKTVSCRQVTSGSRNLTVAGFSTTVRLCNPLNSQDCRNFPVNVGGQTITVPTMTSELTQCSVKKDGTSASPTGTVSYRAKKVSLNSISIPTPWGRRTWTPEYEVPDYPAFTQDFSVLCKRNDTIDPGLQLHTDGSSLFGLRNLNHNTQMDQIEVVRPTFLMAVLGNNHVLGCVFSGEPDKGCLSNQRKAEFEAGLDEFERRVAAIKVRSGCDAVTDTKCGRLIGGVLATVPDVVSIPFLKTYTGASGCSDAPCLAPALDPACEDESCLLNATEVRQIQEWKAHVNERIMQVAARLGFKVFDAARFFSEARRVELEESGLPLRGVDSRGRAVLPPAESLVRARMSWPKGDGLAGVFGLDGIHPNRLGHTMLANAIINELNEQFGFEGAATIPNLDEYAALAADALNQHPVDLQGSIGALDTLRRQTLAILQLIFSPK